MWSCRIANSSKDIVPKYRSHWLLHHTHCVNRVKVKCSDVWRLWIVFWKPTNRIFLTCPKSYLVENCQVCNSSIIFKFEAPTCIIKIIPTEKLSFAKNKIMENIFLASCTFLSSSYSVSPSQSSVTKTNISGHSL